MLGLKKSPFHRNAKHASAGNGSNPFDSDGESEKKTTLTSARRTSSEPTLVDMGQKTNPFDDDNDDVKETSSSSYSLTSSARNKYKNDFRDSGGLENQSVQELEDYSVYKAEETTKAVNGCLKIAEEIREDATKTLVTLHQQGEQITRTHYAAADIDHDLSRVCFFVFSFLCFDDLFFTIFFIAFIDLRTSIQVNDFKVFPFPYSCETQTQCLFAATTRVSIKIFSCKKFCFLHVLLVLVPKEGYFWRLNLNGINNFRVRSFWEVLAASSPRHGSLRRLVQ